MKQFVDGAYNMTSQLFGPDSGIPGWAWMLVLAALLWKLLIPERRTAKDRDTALAAMMIGGSGNGESGKKKDKKKKK